MKIILPFLFLILSLGKVFAEGPNLINYTGYKSNTTSFCASSSQPWMNGKTQSLIKQTNLFYTDITNKDDSDQKYKDYLTKIHADPSRISIINIISGPTFLEKASYVYKETMGAIYACAVINAKIRIIDTLLVKIPSTQSNLKERLTKQSTYLKDNIEKNGCLKTTDSSELSLKKTLLDDTTYQYCNYRQYLFYLNSASKESLDIYYSGTTSNNRSNPLDNTEVVAQKIAQSANKITNEITHTKEIFPQALVAFNEFEKTYASHIILEFILQDYLDLRESLKRVMNPIGQVIYKASNAQSPR